MKTTIIAEAGVNHNGSLAIAKQMAQTAHEAGVDFVKFQTFVPSKLVSRFAEKAAYQKEATGEGSQLSMLENLSLSFDEFRELQAYCKELGVGFLSTPFDLPSIAFLEELDLPLWKIPSGEITNLPYLIEIARTGKPVLLSTGMCDISEVREAMEALRAHGAGEITLLHCVSQYPASFEDVNLLAIESLRCELRVPVGYSDHTQGITVPVGAVGMRATVIEKHFTLSRGMKGPDHTASLEPQELRDMVQAIRNMEVALGSSEKACTASERQNRGIARKSIVAACPIQKGDILTEANLTTKRPGIGITPMRWFEVLGQHAGRDFGEDEQIEL